MSIRDEYPIILAKRFKEFGLDDTPDYYETSPAIKAEIDLFTRDLQKTVSFLDNECTGEQLAWLTEVTDEISAKLQSWEFIDALYRCAEKYPKEEKKYYLKRNISFAEGQLNDDIYYQRYPKEKEARK